MADDVDLGKLSSPMFNADEAVRLATEKMNDGTWDEQVPLPENFGVLLSVGYGLYRENTPIHIAIGDTWNHLNYFTMLAGDILAYSTVDQVSVRIVSSDDLMGSYKVQTRRYEEIMAEVDKNVSANKVDVNSLHQNRQENKPI